MGSSSRMERSRVDQQVGRPSSTFGAEIDPVEPMKRRGMMNPAPSYALPLFSSLVRRNDSDITPWQPLPYARP